MKEKKDILSNASVIDLNHLPTDVIFKFSHNEHGYMMSAEQLILMLVGKPGRGNRNERTKRDRQIAQAAIALRYLYEATERGDEAKIAKQRARCEAIMGKAWTDAKLAERLGIRQSEQAAKKVGLKIKF